MDGLVWDLDDSSIDDLLLDKNLLVDVVDLLNLDNLLPGDWLLNNSVNIDLLHNPVWYWVLDDLLLVDVDVLLYDDWLLDDDLDVLFLLFGAGRGSVVDIVVG